MLEAIDVDVIFGPPARPTHAVKGAGAQVTAGKVVALVGESGSGKTTLGRVLAGLQPPTAGSVRLYGEPLPPRSSGALRDWRMKVGFVYQDAIGSLSPHQTAVAAVAEVVRRKTGGARREAAERARGLLAAVGLPPDTHGRRPSGLSGGQARRVGVARVLALEPTMLVADEPTAGLDVSVQGGLLNLLRSTIDERGVGLLLITHNLPTVRWIADEVVVMYLGHVVEAGPTRDVFARPLHPYTRALVGSAPGFEGPPAEPLAGEVTASASTGCVFRSRCPLADGRCESPPATIESAGRRVACHRPLA